MSIEPRTLGNGKTVYDVVVYCESRDARGRRRKISRTARTKQAAIALEATLKVEASTGAVRDSRRTVADLMEEWLKAGDWSPKTRYDYRLLVDSRILPHLGGIKLDRLGARHLDALYKSMRDQHFSGRTIRNTHAVLRAALGRAVKWQWIPANVALQATVGPVGGKAGAVASLEQVERLLGAAEGPLQLAVRLAATTGARRSELCGLDWSDFDFDRSTVTISRAVVQTAATVHTKSTKTHAERVLYLDAATVALLRQHRGIGPVLGLTPVQLSWAFSALCRRLGIEGLGLHSLRHFVGTALIAGHDVATVAKHLGHSTPATTMAHYLHAVEQRSIDAADAMGALLRG